MRLYLDDNYDYSNGSFMGMSPRTEAQFRRDLRLFYTVFTGKQDMPDTIKKFSDIKLRDYSKTQGCQLPEAYFKSKYTMSKKDELFVKYANNIKSMIQNAARNQNKLLEVINQLFTIVTDPYSGNRVIRVNPKLTDELLQRVVENTRKYIINLYVKCETDYVEGVKLFEAIVESKILETTKNQITKLSEETKRMVEENKPPQAPAPEETRNIDIKPLPTPLPAAVPPPPLKEGKPDFIAAPPLASETQKSVELPKPAQQIAQPTPAVEPEKSALGQAQSADTQKLVPALKPGEQPNPASSVQQQAEPTEQPKPALAVDQPTEQPKPALAVDQPTEQPKPALAVEQPADTQKQVPALSAEKPAEQPNPVLQPNPNAAFPNPPEQTKPEQKPQGGRRSRRRHRR
jgi:hypothetical protein